MRYLVTGAAGFIPLYLRDSVLASQRVFEAAVQNGVRIVFASSSSIYGEAERYPTPE
jgi:UDP-glucuronate 4-epimerase